MAPIQACPLCAGLSTSRYFSDGDREYFRCDACALVFLRPDLRPGVEEERQRYLRHQNSGDDAGYRRHLRKLADPLMTRIPPGARGLDFGSGPAPVLASILQPHGFDVALYDPLATRAGPGVLHAAGKRRALSGTAPLVRCI